jgi:hypothetical protein
MARNQLAFCFTTLIVVACSSVAMACRYTVRDVAFVDLNERPYRLFLFTDQQQNSELATAMREAASEKLADANVVAEHVDLHRFPDHPARRYAVDSERLPAAVLVAPDERTLVLEEAISPKSGSGEFARLFETIVDSPTRREIFSRVCDVHSVLLVVDGEDERVNRETLEMVRKTIPQVRDALTYMPKPIKEPPHLIHLSRQQADEERVLLWSLGVDHRPVPPSQIALLFGRGRKLGPVLRFPEDQRRKLIRSLAVVGQDCECGLDRRWMQGQMVPHNWTAHDEAVATRKLNFDPGNPLVKAEINRILSRGPGTEPGGLSELETAEKIFPALSYQEIALDEEPSASVDSETRTTDETKPTGSATPALKKSTEAEADRRDLPPGRWTFILLAGSALLVIGIGLLILLRGGEAKA